MSMFDNDEKDNLYREIVNFLENYSILDLHSIVSCAVRDVEEEMKNNYGVEE